MAAFMTGIMTGIMMPPDASTASVIFSMAVIPSLRTARYSAGIRLMRVTIHLRAARHSAGIVHVAVCLRAARYSTIMICMPVICAVGITVLSIVHMRSCFRAPCYTAYAVAVFANLCTAVNSTGSVCMRCLHRTVGHPAIMVCVPVIGTVRIIVCSIVHMRACFRTLCYAAYVVTVFTNLCAAVNSAKTVLVYFCLCAARHPTGKRHFFCPNRILNLFLRYLLILCLCYFYDRFLRCALGLH